MTTVSLNLNHGEKVFDPVDPEGNAQARLALTVAAAQTSALNEGVYDVWCTVDCYIKVDPVDATASLTTLTGYLIKAGNVVPVVIRQGSMLGGIVGAGTGTLSYHRVG